MTDRPKIDAALEDLRLLEVANRLHNRGEVSDALRVKAAHTLLAEQQWVSVDERLPKKDGEYIISGEFGVRSCEYSKRFNGWRGMGSGRAVKFWCELPAPPTGGKS